MNTYWDLEDNARSLLTQEQVERYIEIEMMRNGIVVERAPQPVSPLPEMERKRVYLVSVGSAKVAFTKHTDALAFIDLRPWRTESDYRIGYRVEYVRPIDDAEVVAMDLPMHDEIERRRSQLESHRQAEDAYEKAQQAFRKSAEAASKATAGVWEDWHEQRHLRQRCLAIEQTFDQYVALAENDEDMAARFLLRAYDVEDVARAGAWLGRDALSRVAREATTEITLPGNDGDTA